MAERTIPLGINILSILFIIGGLYGLVMSFGVLTSVEAGERGLLGLALILGLPAFSIGSLIVSYWLRNLDKRGYHGAIALLLIAAATDIAVAIADIPTEIQSSALVDIILAGYIYSRKSSFVEQSPEDEKAEAD